MKGLWVVWTVLTGLAAVLCTIGCILPYWIKGYVHITAPLKTELSHDLNEDPSSPWREEHDKMEIKAGLPTDLGLFRRCGFPMYTTPQEQSLNSDVASSIENQPVGWHKGCGHYSHINRFPHIAWYIAFFALILACAFLCFTAFFLVMLGFALYLIASPLVCRCCQTMQLSAGKSEG